MILAVAHVEGNIFPTINKLDTLMLRHFDSEKSYMKTGRCPFDNPQKGDLMHETFSKPHDFVLESKYSDEEERKKNLKFVQSFQI